MTTVYADPHNTRKLCLAECDRRRESGEDIVYTDYIPIERRFPNWTTGRPDVLAFLPEKLIFKRGSDISSIALDYSWAQNMFDRCPLMYKSEFEKLLDNMANGIRFSIFGYRFLDEFYGQPMMQQLLSALNYKVQTMDAKRRDLDKVTSMEYIQHHLGIRETELSYRTIIE